MGIRFAPDRKLTCCVKFHRQYRLQDVSSHSCWQNWYVVWHFVFFFQFSVELKHCEIWFAQLFFAGFAWPTQSEICLSGTVNVASLNQLLPFCFVCWLTHCPKTGYVSTIYSFVSFNSFLIKSSNFTIFALFFFFYKKTRIYNFVASYLT